MTHQFGGNDEEPQYDCTDGCGASYRNGDLARLCCDWMAQAALRGRMAAERGRRDEAPGRTITGP